MSEGKNDDGHEMWIEAGLKAIVKSGIDGMRVEIVAKALGVTKGGFYRRFKDRRALLDAMLESWRVDRSWKKTTSARQGLGSCRRLSGRLADSYDPWYSQLP